LDLSKLQLKGLFLYYFTLCGRNWQVGKFSIIGEKELVINYPEADAFAGAAASVWNSSTSAGGVHKVLDEKFADTAHFKESEIDN
jgi:hypothetical protein